MTDDTSFGDFPELVMGKQFQLLDHKGRVRAVLGDASGGAEEWFPGLSLFDEEGRLRATVVASPQGTALSFFARGNVVAEVGVGESPVAVSPGPYLVLCDADGGTAWQVRVNRDGEVNIGQPDEGPGGDTPPNAP